MKTNDFEDISYAVVSLSRHHLQKLIGGDFTHHEISKLFKDDEYNQKLMDACNYARQKFSTRAGQAMTLGDELPLFAIFKMFDEWGPSYERDLLHVMRHEGLIEELRRELECRHTTTKYGGTRTAQDWRKGKR